MFIFSSQYLSKEALTKFDLEYLGQCHWVQHSQLCHSMANINLHKSHSGHFGTISYHLRDNILKFLPCKFRSRSHGKTKGLKPSIMISNLHKVITDIFALALTVLEKLIFWTFYLDNLGHSHGGKKQELHHSKANIHLNERYNWQFCTSSSCLQEINILNF